MNLRDLLLLQPSSAVDRIEQGAKIKYNCQRLQKEKCNDLQQMLGTSAPWTTEGKMNGLANGGNQEPRFSRAKVFRFPSPSIQDGQSPDVWWG